MRSRVVCDSTMPWTLDGLSASVHITHVHSLSLGNQSYQAKRGEFSSLQDCFLVGFFNINPFGNRLMVMSHTFVHKRRSHQDRTDRTRCKRIAPEAIRLLVYLMCLTDAFHLDKKYGISLGTKLDFPIGKKLFHLIVNSGKAFTTALTDGTPRWLPSW